MPVVQLCEFLKKTSEDVTFVPVTNSNSIFLMLHLLCTPNAYEHRKRVFVCSCHFMQQELFLKDIVHIVQEMKSESCKELGDDMFNNLYGMGHDPTRVHERIILTPMYVILFGRVPNDASVTISASVQSGSVGSLALFESDEDHFPLFYSAAAFSSGARRTRSIPSEMELHRSAMNDK